MKHEGAWVQEARDGRVVVYMGDDEQFEYIYRFVSNLRWRQARRRGINPLDDGILYVARFNGDGSGEWLPLTPENPALAVAGCSLNDILINTRTAADLVGATKMDRPEWIDTFPESLTVIGTLTNNTASGTTGNNPRTGLPNSPVDATNPRTPNPVRPHPQVVLQERLHRADLRLGHLRARRRPSNPTHGSTIVGDKFGSPDGIYVAPSGRLWIQTDVSGNTINTGAYAGFGNNQMLCADPTTRRSAPIPCRTERLRDYRRLRDSGRDGRCSWASSILGKRPSGSNDPPSPSSSARGPMATTESDRVPPAL